MAHDCIAVNIWVYFLSSHHVCMYIYARYKIGVVLCKNDTVKGGILGAHIMIHESNDWNGKELS